MNQLEFPFAAYMKYVSYYTVDGQFTPLINIEEMNRSFNDFIELPLFDMTPYGPIYRT